MPSALGSTFATAVWMINRIHRRASHGWTDAHPTVAAGLSEHDVHVLRVSDRADSGTACGRNTPNFPGRQRDLRPLRLASNQHGRRSGRTTQTAAATCLEFHVVNLHAQRDRRHWQTVSDFRRRCFTTLHGCASLQTLGGEDKTLLAIGVLDQRDTTGAIWVVLNRLHLAWNIIFVPAEVDQPVVLHMPAATMAGGDLALIVPATGLYLSHAKMLRSLSSGRQFGEVRHARVSAARTCRVVGSNTHGSTITFRTD